MDMEVTFSDLLKYIGTALQNCILPILPAGAKLSELSKISPAQLGKFPGMYACQRRLNPDPLCSISPIEP